MAEQLLNIKGVALLLDASVSIARKTLSDLGVSIAINLGAGRGRGPRWWHHEIVEAVERKRQGNKAPVRRQKEVIWDTKKVLNELFGKR